MNIVTGQTEWAARGFCDGCGAPAGQPCQRGRIMACPGRPMLPAGVTATDLEPGPIWTNGKAPAAADLHFNLPEGVDMALVTGEPRRVTCPVWCTRHEHGGQTSEPHRIELLNLTVQDGERLEDVPLHLEALQALDSDRPMIVLEIGHALFQPTNVVLSRSDAARLGAALITANALTAQ